MHPREKGKLVGRRNYKLASIAYIRGTRRGEVRFGVREDGQPVIILKAIYAKQIESFIILGGWGEVSGVCQENSQNIGCTPFFKILG